MRPLLLSALLTTTLLLTACDPRSDSPKRPAPEFAPASPTTVISAPPPPGKAEWQGPVSYAHAVNSAAPAVVNIYSTQIIRQRNPWADDPVLREFFGMPDMPRERMAQSLGSGVIVSPDGYVLTNNHVVAEADQIVVALKDGRETKAKVIGLDPDTDLAVLKIELGKLPVLPMRTDNPPVVGDVVLAIGNPFGVGQTVTQGIISALGRSGLGINTYEDFIQTDAAINPGNSGGALVDVWGNLVGINSAIYSRSGGNMGIGFAIPAKLAKEVMLSLVDKGKVVRGWLGIEVAALDERIAEQIGSKREKGVVVARLVRGGPADAAGLETGDILLAIDGRNLDSADQAVRQIATLKPGSAVKITVEREGKPQTLSVKIGERPSARG